MKATIQYISLWFPWYDFSAILSLLKIMLMLVMVMTAWINHCNTTPAPSNMYEHWNICTFHQSVSSTRFLPKLLCTNSPKLICTSRRLTLSKCTCIPDSAIHQYCELSDIHREVGLSNPDSVCQLLHFSTVIAVDEKFALYNQFLRYWTQWYYIWQYLRNWLYKANFSSTAITFE